ncbi:MAG: NERD domain-containing protein [Bacilli bacterium]|nr:NERD domain-containing protein [Bacilli bacterium]
MSKISRGKKGESKVKDLLKKIKEYHRVMNDITFVNERSEMTHQIDHILIHPHGVFVIETKNYYGKIDNNTHDSFWLKEVNGKVERISNPLKQNKSHVTMVNRALEKKYDVIPVVVFVKNNAPYIGDENVINFKDLILFINTYPYKKIIEKNEIDEIYKALKNASSKISKAEHLENIGYLKQIRKEIQDEISYAIESGICPRCDHKMIVNGFSYHCSNCDFKFKL